MKQILIFFFIFALAQEVFSLDLDEKYKEIKPSEIELEIGADCGQQKNNLDLIVKVKNNGKDVISLSDSFLGLSEGMSDSFVVIENPLGKKINLPYLGIIQEKKKDFHFPYSLVEGHELHIRYPISKFFQMDLKNNYEVTYNVEFFSNPKELIFIGYAKIMIGFSDCEKESGHSIKYKKISPTGFFVNPVGLGWGADK